MQLQIDPKAGQELFDAADWYENQVTGLGDDFLDEVAQAYRCILEHPAAWREMARGVRRYLLRRFPYGVYYKVEKDLVLIYAITHLHRHPDAWKKPE